jgi:3-dehydrosphinganine reductase
MIKRGSGHIVNISSIAGFLGVYGYTAYGASKYAVRGFSDVLRAEMKPLGIQVSVVFPPDTDTPQLAYENQFKPPETKELAGNAHAVSPEIVAKAILRGVARRQYVIIPGFEGKLYYWLGGLVGTGLYPIMDLMVAQARRHSGHEDR